MGAGWEQINNWGICEFMDVAASWIREPNEEARVLIEQGLPVVIECPETCNKCEKWGMEIDKHGVCESCIESSGDWE